jgi:hypothetical protein
MPQKPVSKSRRSFLGLSAAAAGGLAATPPPAEGEVREESEQKPRQAADTYRETDHIRTAYDRMRF